MEADELMSEYVVEIERPVIKNKVAFLKYGSRGEFEAIRQIVRFKKPEPDKIETFIKICDSRLDRLKSYSSDLMTFLSIVLATFTFSLYLAFDKYGIPIDSIIPGIKWFLSLKFILLKISISTLLLIIIT
jgi:hypothetical protein